METQVVPSSNNGAARHVATSPPAAAPLAAIRGASFDDVRAAHRRQLEPVVPGRRCAARAAEVTRRLRREPGQVKLRAWCDESGQSAGSLRAILVPGYAPVDDLRIFEMLRTNMGALLGEYLFQRVEPGDETSQYAAVLREVRSVRGDDLVPGWSLRTSEVGRAPISVDDYWLRLVCMNGKRLAQCTQPGG